jgi:hypothetical protein
MPEEKTELQPEPQKASIVKEGVDRYKSFIFGVQVILFLIIVASVITGILAPQMLLVFLNFLWILTLFIVILFLVLGGMVMIGLKNEAKGILEVFMEGTLSVVDFFDFLKLIAKNFVQIVQDVIYFLVPFFSYVLAFLIYIGLLLLYKWVGTTYDVSIMTIILTVVLMVFIGLLNRPGKEDPETNEKWIKRVQKKFKDIFGDGMEIMIFVFFLTMDSTNLFFLPKSLNVELHASLFGYNLMERGMNIQAGFDITMTLIMLTVGIEIIRFGMRIVWGGVYFYREIHQYMGSENPKFGPSQQIKHSLRQSFDANKDDIIKFITYLTILIGVFLLFPKLKLLSMAMTSVTAIVLDLVFRERLSVRRASNDLFGKIIAKVFNV